MLLLEIHQNFKCTIHPSHQRREKLGNLQIICLLLLLQRDLIQKLRLLLQDHHLFKELRPKPRPKSIYQCYKRKGPPTRIAPEQELIHLALTAKGTILLHQLHSQPEGNYYYCHLQLFLTKLIPLCNY